jgi:hypothetical protein
MCLVNLAIPPNIIKQRLPKTFLYPEVGDIIIDETPTREQVQDLTIANWIVIERSNCLRSIWALIKKVYNR